MGHVVNGSVYGSCCKWLKLNAVTFLFDAKHEISKFNRFRAKENVSFCKFDMKLKVKFQGH